MTCSSILKKENNNVVHQVHGELQKASAFMISYFHTSVPKPLDPIQYVAGEALRDLADPDVSVMLLDLGRLS